MAKIKGFNMKEFASHQQRVVQEKLELDEKLSKLSAFISSPSFSSTVNDVEEVALLICQEDIMKDYSDILAERISAF